MLDFILANMTTVIAIAVPAVLVGGALLSIRRSTRAKALSDEKAEAFFRAAFPELQPHLHPENVAAYVLARKDKQFSRRDEWAEPAGFAAAKLARFADDPKGRGERTLLVDGAGRRFLDFILEPKSGALGAVRVGEGKFTVRQDAGKPPRVSYWHPEREFEWRGRGQWKFKSRVADETIDTRDPHWSDSSSLSSSWSPTTTAAVATAGVVGLGGSFDGGGASAGWDGDSPKSSDADSSGGDSAGGDASAGDASGGDATSTRY